MVSIQSGNQQIKEGALEAPKRASRKIDYEKDDSNNKNEPTWSKGTKDINPHEAIMSTKMF